VAVFRGNHAAAAHPAGHGQARRDAIAGIIADLLPVRRGRQCERVKEPPRNTFAVNKRGETPPGTKGTLVRPAQGALFKPDGTAGPHRGRGRA
jgi:hypothetical protein